jgi:rod shape-determining protein MreB
MAVAQAIKSIPLDKVESVFNNGIVLTGGGAMIYGMDTMMTKVLGIEVKIPPSPVDSVARGLSIINTRIPVKGRGTQKTITDAVAEYYKD